MSPSLPTTTFLLATLTTLALSQTTAPKLTATCADVVIFMARGNNAPYHDSRTFPFVDATCAKLAAQGKSCDYIEIEFDATLNGPYCDQIAQGARNGISQITAFNRECPCSAVVLNGYSEGANVVGDVLAGPGGCTGSSTGIDPASAAGKAVAAALLWGDVRHTANQVYNVLDGADKGPNPRPASQLSLMDRYASVLRSYCSASDPVCAGGSVVADHLDYFEKYTDDASAWVAGKIGGFKGACAGTTTTTTTTPSPTFVVSSSSPSDSDSASSLPVATTMLTSVSVSAAPSSSSSSSSSPSSALGDGCVVVYEIEYVYV